MPRSKQATGLPMRELTTKRFVRPVEDRGPNEIAVEGLECEYDARVRSEVVLSAGNVQPPSWRNASLRIGNQVVVLDPVAMNTLAVALLAVNDTSRRKRRDVVRFDVPTTNNP